MLDSRLLDSLVPAALLAPAFVVHLAATLVMTGLIWFVQVVHYPLFAGVGPDGFRAYAAEHGRRTTWVVAAPMLAELGTGVLLAWRRPPWVPAGTAWAGLALLTVVWASTALLQVPRHNELGHGWNAGAHRRLVASNWLRTAAWTARAALLGTVAARALTRLG
jgi:hypothetical protein